MSFQSAIRELSDFASKADVKTEMRISFSFSTVRDKAYFINELSREVEPLFHRGAFDRGNHSDFRLNGIHVRIV